MAHPAEFFVKYNLAQAWGDEDSDMTLPVLNKMLSEFGVLGLLEVQYDYIMQDFSPPDGFKFNNVKHAPTRQFMEDEKILAMWKEDRTIQRIYLEIIDGHCMVQHDIHLLLLGRVPNDIICQKLNAKWSLSPEFTEGMLDAYQHYFWNVGNVRMEEWSELLGMKPYKDAFMAALMCGEQQALYRAGFSPRVDGNRALKEAHRQAYFRMEALRFEPDSKSTIEAWNKISARLLNLHERLFAEGSGLADQLKQFKQIMMKRKDPNVKAMEKVINSVGSYSDDGSVLYQGDQNDSK